jgi:hypothetical protein
MKKGTILNVSLLLVIAGRIGLGHRPGNLDFEPP